MRSQDGLSWTRVPTPLHPDEFAAVGNLLIVAAISTNPPKIPDVRMSKDGGKTWTQAPTLDPVFSPQFDDTWQLIRTKRRVLLLDRLDHAMLPHSPGHSYTTRVRRLSENAERWEDITPCFCQVVLAGESTSYEDVLASSSLDLSGTPLALLITMDGGTTWSFRVEPPRSVPIVLDDALVVDNSFLELFAPRYLYSPDAGVSWRPIGDGLPTFQVGTLSNTRLMGRTIDSLLLINEVPPDSNVDLYGCSLK
jgi:hypothetical protein